jgi:hypothetical protein
MAQHDMVVDNAPGVAVRADINSALAALFSTSSGPTEPSVKVAGMLWYDTSAAPVVTLKIRDTANAAWVTVPTSGGAVVYLPTSGGTMTGSLLLTPAASPAANEAIPLSTVNALDQMSEQDNLIVNGDMTISQKNQGALITGTGTSAQYPVDMFQFSTAGSAFTVTAQRNVNIAPQPGQVGRARIVVACTVAKGALAAADYVQISTSVEGTNLLPLGWGTATGKPAILRFGFKGPAGVYSVCFRNASSPTQQYLATFTISAGQANTDTYQTIVVPAPPTGPTWQNGTSLGLIVIFSLVAGTNFTGTFTGWDTTNLTKFAHTSQFNFVASTSNIVNLWDVQLSIDYANKGVSPSFKFPYYQAELQRCRRYYAYPIQGNLRVFNPTAAANNYAGGFFYPAEMRAAPTATKIGAGTAINLTSNVMSGLGTNSARINIVTAAATGDSGILDSAWELDAQMI